MRIMAFSAIHLVGIDIEVGLVKSSRFIVVAFAAQRLNRLHDQIELGRKMGLVAYLAIYNVGWGVHINLRWGRRPGISGRTFSVAGAGGISGIGGKHPGFQIGVAGQAQVRGIRQGKFFQIRLMRAVAAGALTGDNRLVFAFDVGDFFSGIRAVAGVT